MHLRDGKERIRGCELGNFFRQQMSNLSIIAVTTLHPAKFLPSIEVVEAQIISKFIQDT
jgi:hypothetical protein